MKIKDLITYLLNNYDCLDEIEGGIYIGEKDITKLKYFCGLDENNKNISILKLDHSKLGEDFFKQLLK